MKFDLLFLTLFLTQILSAQTFTEVPSAHVFDGTFESSIAFADVDGDNDEDVLITGRISGNEQISKLYINNGLGNFTEMPDTPFDGVLGGSIAFADVDGDNDQDVLITGRRMDTERISKLYTNDGQGNFTEVLGTPFDAVYAGSIAFADVDGDNDQDVLITGSRFFAFGISKLYTNDGQGNFTEVLDTPFEPVRTGSIAFADVDGDNDQDVLITGRANMTNSAETSKLYTNDGLGNFTEVTGTPFEAVDGSCIAFADVDGDNDPDVLITGESASQDYVSKLYLNNGLGNFIEAMDVPFDGVAGGSIAFSDVDNDNDQDVLITGRISLFSQDRISKLYRNDGLGNFSEAMGMPFEGVSVSSVAFSDVDGDNDRDILITGLSSLSGGISNLHTNDGLGNFAEVMGLPFDGVSGGSIAFSDVDGDTHPDVLITGEKIPIERIAKLYTNDGLGNFSEVPGTPFDGVSFSSIAFSDVDGDTDSDVLITGMNNPGQRIAKLYTNDGQGNFTEVPDTPFEGVWNGSIAFSDVDGDTDPDVLITGISGSFDLITKLYTNDGLGNFFEMSGTPFDGVKSGSVAFADVDGDNDQDVIISGEKLGLERIAKLYMNDGLGNFTEMLGTPFDGVAESSIAFSDVDGDADQDVLITGSNTSFEGISKLYINDGLGNFSEFPGAPFDGVLVSSIAFSDVDGDTDPDVLITGENNLDERISKLYTNDGVGNFSEVLESPFDGVWFGSIAFTDLNGDTDPDVLITGFNNSDERISKLYFNDGIVSSINELRSGFNFKFTPYPNPVVSNHLKVDFNLTESSFVTVNIYNLNGQLLSQQKKYTVPGLQTILVDIDALSAGNYFIQIDDGKRKGVAKFIVP